MYRDTEYLAPIHKAVDNGKNGQLVLKLLLKCPFTDKDVKTSSGKVNAPVKMSHRGTPRLTQGILMEKQFISQNRHPAMSCCCQNPLPKDLYFYHLLCQNDVRVISERTAVVRVPCMVRCMPVIFPWQPGGHSPRIHLDRCIILSFVALIGACDIGWSM